MRRPCAWLILCLALAAPAGAQTVVTSAGPERVSVTVYRAPGRTTGREFDLEWLEGYALISETRRVSIPAGESEVRFEGVAGGIQPQSAIVTGFPDGVVERNRDAFLLSGATLLDRSLGRRVHLRRTSRATGAVTEQEAVIRSGADGAVVLQTPDGFEALRCTGMRERLIYNEVPAGLSARPTLSARVRSATPLTATVTLSYLATGFDWQANYVANLSDDGSRLNLFAWLTLASGDETSFRNAQTQAVAGRLNRQQVDPDNPESPRLQLRCWAQARTHEIPLRLPPAPGRNARRDSNTIVDSVSAQDIGNMPDSEADESVIVTGTRARQEELGDLKLYRIPEPVTVAARSQKQVAFLQQDSVQFRTVYRERLSVGDDSDRQAVRFLVTRNRPEEGLGLPLPAGRIQLFDAAAGRPILIGEGALADRAIGEDVEIALGESPSVRGGTETIDTGRRWEDHVLTVTNDQPAPVQYEAEFDVDEDERFRPRERLASRHGRPLWAVTIPANGSATLRYRVVRTD